MEIIDFKKKKLTNEHQKSYKNENIWYICKITFKDKHAKDKKYCKIRTIVFIQKNIEVLQLQYVI